MLELFELEFVEEKSPSLVGLIPSINVVLCLVYQSVDFDSRARVADSRGLFPSFSNLKDRDNFKREEGSETRPRRNINDDDDNNDKLSLKQ